MSADQDGRGVPVPIVVTGCMRCPLRLDHGTRSICLHPEAVDLGGWENVSGSENRDECPLDANPAIVVRAEGVPQ